jgi:hypothetical protein
MATFLLASNSYKKNSFGFPWQGSSGEDVPPKEGKELLPPSS